ncbi:MAG: hypothetical protein QX198_14015 [Methylococcaceae bacterium]
MEKAMILLNIALFVSKNKEGWMFLGGFKIKSVFSSVNIVLYRSIFQYFYKIIEFFICKELVFNRYSDAVGEVYVVAIIKIRGESWSLGLPRWDKEF